MENVVSPTSKTREHELRALYEALKEQECDKLALITWNTDEHVEYNDVNVNILSVKDMSSFL